MLRTFFLGLVAYSARAFNASNDLRASSTDLIVGGHLNECIPTSSSFLAIVHGLPTCATGNIQRYGKPAKSKKTDYDRSRELEADLRELLTPLLNNIAKNYQQENRFSLDGISKIKPVTDEYGCTRGVDVSQTGVITITFSNSAGESERLIVTPSVQPDRTIRVAASGEVYNAHPRLWENIGIESLTFPIGFSPQEDFDSSFHFSPTMG